MWASWLGSSSVLGPSLAHSHWSKKINRGKTSGPIRQELCTSVLYTIVYRIPSLNSVQGVWRLLDEHNREWEEDVYN
jgi:hypothetical protein